ncbi:hypothetical protein SVAN01_09071 [Stagonosporopsis vannaccii]|nr:hypothetical protein SVAN01_09071 [Stagonosporopsis vannaccii]
MPDHPPDIDAFPTAVEVQEYLLSYAEHFRLESYLRLNTLVRQIRHDDVRHQCANEIDDREVQCFYILVIAIGGLTTLPNIRKIERIELFKGIKLHARASKKHEEFRGKRVVVVGFGNTAADMAAALANVAYMIYISHREGARMNWTTKYFPILSARMVDRCVKSLQDISFKLRLEWGFEPPQWSPIVSDPLVGHLKRGHIESVKGM